MQKIQNTRVDRVSLQLKTISQDASRRTVYVVERSAHPWNPFAHKSIIICPEPSPDVAVQYAAAWNNNFEAYGKAGGNLANPATQTIGAVLGAVPLISTNDVSSALKSISKPGQLINPSELTNQQLTQLSAQLGLKASFGATQSQDPQQLAISNYINLLRSGLFYSCLNAMNYEQPYSPSNVAAQQQELEAQVSGLMALQNARIIPELVAAANDKNSKLSGADIKAISTAMLDPIGYQQILTKQRFQKEGLDLIENKDYVGAIHKFQEAQRAASFNPLAPVSGDKAIQYWTPPTQPSETSKPKQPNAAKNELIQNYSTQERIVRHVAVAE